MNSGFVEIELPIVRGEKLYIPFVGAIIEREFAGKKQILIQVRAKESDTIYAGSLEIPGGKMNAGEDIYETLRREVKEETGLEVTVVSGEDKRIDHINERGISTLIEPFCITQMRNGPFIGIIFLCRATGEPALLTNEARDARWIDIAELRQLVQTSPERFYTAFLAPLKKYLSASE